MSKKRSKSKRYRNSTAASIGVASHAVSKAEDKVEIKNTLVSPSGAGSGCDRGSGYRAHVQNNLHNSIQGLNYYNLLALYSTDWSAQKIVDLPVFDMLRNGWHYEGVDAPQSKRLEDAESKIDLNRALKEALRLERIVGGAVVYIGVSDGEKDASKPLELSAVGLNDLRYLNTISSTEVGSLNLETNPLKFDYGRPRSYTINGQEIHRSRLLIFDGDPLLRRPLNTGTNVVQNSKGFGVPILQRVYEDIIRSSGTRNAAFHLVNMASIMLLKTDMSPLLSSKEGDAKLGELQRIIEEISLYRGSIVSSGDSDDTDVTFSNPSFGALPELIITFLQVLSAASDIPATRFLGQAPGGLNATGKSDLENYYNSISAKQEHHLRPQLEKLLEVMGRSALGKSFVDLKPEIVFDPLWNPSSLESAEQRKVDSSVIVELAGAGLISGEEAKRELEAREVVQVELDDTSEFESFVPEGLEGPAVDIDAELKELLRKDANTA